MKRTVNPSLQDQPELAVHTRPREAQGPPVVGQPVSRPACGVGQTVSLNGDDVWASADGAEIVGAPAILPFTTVTCNLTYRTAAHIDAGDLQEGFGVLCCLGEFEGCDLVFPQYGTAVRYREGDVLLANVHKVHGNSPLLNPDGSEPELDKEPERLVCVFFYQEDMDQCLSTPEEEMEFVNNRKKGDPIYPKKKKKS